MTFYPDNAAVPDELRTGDLLLRMLTPEHVQMDYEAVMESQEQLRTFEAGSWPAPDFRLDQNLEDLERHAREHRERVGFTYTVMNPEGTRCEGCVYINSWERMLGSRHIDATIDDVSVGEHEAVVTFWARTSGLERDLDRQLLDGLLRWFGDDWAFSRVTFMTNDGLERKVTVLEEAGLERIYSFGSNTTDWTWHFYSRAVKRS